MSDPGLTLPQSGGGDLDGGAVAEDFGDAAHHFGRVVADGDDARRADVMAWRIMISNASARDCSQSSVSRVMFPPRSVCSVGADGADD